MNAMDSQTQMIVGVVVVVLIAVAAYFLYRKNQSTGSPIDSDRSTVELSKNSAVGTRRRAS